MQTLCDPRVSGGSKDRKKENTLKKFSVEIQYSDDLGVARCMRHIWRWHVVSCVHYRGRHIFAGGCTGMGGAGKHVALFGHARRCRICREVVK